MEKIILENGLRIVCASSPTDTIYLGLAMDAGTRDELDSESGMAHFAEHLSFKGTDKRTSRQIITRMESVGGDLNAFTGKEETVYYCTCQKEHFARAVDLLFDVVFRSVYPKEEMEKEVEVVIDEIESYNDSPSELIYDDFEAMLFPEHPLGRSILGNAERLRQYQTDDVVRFAHRMYLPENAVLFVYGNVDIKTILRRLPNKALSRLKHHNVLPQSPYCLLCDYVPMHKVIHKDTHQAHIMMGARAYGGAHPSHLALFMANNILGGPGLSSRLNLALRERYGLVYTVESSLTTYTDTGVWAVYFGCDHKDVDLCKRLVKNELKRLCAAPLSEKALKAAKRQIIGQISLSYDNFESVAIDMGKRMLHYGKTQTKEEFVARIQALTAEKVLCAAREIFNPEQLTILEYK
jgi:predicted Zn-dependent peptidase